MFRLSTFTWSAAALFMAALLVLGTNPEYSLAQTQEPEVQSLPEPRTPFGEGKRNSLGIDIMLNNFGFGLGGQYGRYIGPYTQLTFTTGITSIRDVREQTFRNFFGQKVIPDKYNRALGFPFIFGVKQRLFARKMEDNFRFFVSAGGGPAFAFVFPYLNDLDNNGFRNFIQGTTILEPINDFFKGWDEGESRWGASGEFKIGVDFGKNFSNLTTVEFGYFFYYFPEAIQLMEPRRPIVNDEGFIVDSEPFFDDQSFFGTPKISLIFGGIW